jgi:hypothetical protein
LTFVFLLMAGGLRASPDAVVGALPGTGQLTGAIRRRDGKLPSIRP